jgi:hypothetical protein
LTDIHAGFEPREGDVVYWIKQERDGYEKFLTDTMTAVKSGKARI